jgi:GH18 family chitinase
MKNLVLSLGFLLMIFRYGTIAQQRWVVGYWTNWDHSAAGFQELLAQKTFTHIFHFAVGVDDNGNVYEEDPRVLTVQSKDLITPAHSVGTKVILTIFPATQDGLISAMNSKNRLNLIRSICNVIRTYGYDGVDWDYERGFTPPLQTNWNATMPILRDSLNALGKVLGRPLYNVAFTYGLSWNDYLASSPYFDRIILMGYEMTGPWSRWMVWHGYSIYSRGVTLPCCPEKTNGNIDSLWTGWVRAGVPTTKLMISGSASGCVWTGGIITSNVLGLPTHGGATQPGDDWNPRRFWNTEGVAPYWAADQAYNGLMTTYAAYPTIHDRAAIAAYKSVDLPGSENDQFISFEDPWTLWNKWNYMKNVRNGGGLALWTVWRGRMGVNDWPLLNALKLSIADSSMPPEPSGTFTATPKTLPPGGGPVQLTWTSQNARSASISGIGKVSLNGKLTINISGPAVSELTLSNITNTAILKDTVTVSGVSSRSLFSDNFDRPNGAMGSGWMTSAGNPTISANAVVSLTGGTALAYWKSSAVSPDQFSKGNPSSTLPGYRYAYFGVRMGADGKGYFIKTDGQNSWIVYRPSGGSDQVLQTLNTTFTSRDMAEIRVIGSVISVYKNGFQIGVNQNSAALSSGYPGLGVSPDNNAAVDNLECGILVPSGRGK